MKVAILFPFHSLCFLTLLVLNTLQPLVATAQKIQEPVYDSEGELVRRGESYYVWPLWADNGGLELRHIRNKTCPLYVIRDPSYRGTPVVFHVQQQQGDPVDYIPTLTDLTVRSSILGPCVEDSRVWKLTQVGPPGSTPSLWFVSANGIAGTAPTLFKIEKPRGEYHSYHIYNFKFCPSNLSYQPICGPLGTYVDANGTNVLAFGDGIEPFYVRFQKASTYHPPPKKINQGGLSIV